MSLDRSDLEDIEKLKLELLTYCIKQNDKGDFHWDEHRLCSNWELLLQIAILLKGKLDSVAQTGHVLCALGHSGMVLGGLVARLIRMPLIWIDPLYCVVPASYTKELKQKHVHLIDSLIVQGWNALNTSSLLTRYGASSSSLFVIVNCNNFHSNKRKKLHRLLQIHSILDVNANIEVLCRVMGMGFDEEKVRKIVGRESFWRQLD